MNLCFNNFYYGYGVITKNKYDPITGVLSMDLVQILKDRVIPIVLNQDSTHQNASLFGEKTAVLSSFIPILLSLLKNNPNLISMLQSSLNPRVTDLFPNDSLAKTNLIEAVGHTLPKEETESLLNHSIAPTLGALEDLAGSNDDRSIAHYLEQHKESIASALPLWATSILGGLGVGSATGAFASNTVVEPTATATPSHIAPSTHYTEPPEKEKSSLWFPLIALVVLAILVGLFLRYCNNKEQVVATNAQPAVTNANAQPAFFQLNTDSTGSLVTCQVRIGNPTFTDIIQTEVKQLFNHPIGCGVDSSQQYHAELIDQNGLSSILKLLKGVPNATLTWTGSEIALQGTDAAAMQNLAAQIKPLVPNVNVNVQQAVDMSQAVNNSISDAEKALANINPDQVKPLDIATALNLQIINFATASSDIPDSNKSVLDQAAALMNRVLNVQLTVKGFTDAVGNAESNKTLSHQRAQSVVDYLISKGVDPSKLKAEGYGQENPVADNATEEGKFKNRRIEFAVTNTETGVEREVSPEGVEKVN